MNLRAISESEMRLPQDRRAHLTADDSRENADQTCANENSCFQVKRKYIREKDIERTRKVVDRVRLQIRRCGKRTNP